MYIRNTKGVRLLLVFALLTLSACTTPQYETVNREVFDGIQTELDSASSAVESPGSNQPPDEVLQALVPGLTLESEALQPVEDRFDFAVREPMEVREFFSLLTAGTDYSIVVHPEINGTISALDLKNVTIQEALDQVRALYGYTINRNGNIFRIMPSGLETRIFKVDYLNVNRNGNSNMSVVTSGLISGAGGGMGGSGGGVGGINNVGLGGNLGGNVNNGLGGGNGQAGLGGGGGVGMNSGGANISTRTESDYWEDLEDIINSIIGSAPASTTSTQQQSAGFGLLETLTPSSSSNGRAVIVSPQTGMVVVRAYPDELDQVAEFLARSQDALQRQVVLEAKILEVTLNERFQAGIDLRLLDRVNTDNMLGLRSSFLDDSADGDGGSAAPTNPLDGAAQAFQLAYDASDFDGVIRLLETQGNVQVISSPRITTLNNQKAVFKVGDEEYFSTNPTSNVTTGGNTTVSNQNANLQPFFSGIALDVTPQISESGDIILHIHPLLNTVQEDLKVIGGEQIPLAKSDTRESDSIARARNGEVVIISGLMQTRARGSEAGLPGVRDVPVVGNAFEQTQRDTEKTELVILLRAIVDENSNMRDLIQDHTDSFDDMRRQIDPYYR